MNSCNEKCVNGITSANCVEYDATFTVKQKIVAIDDKLLSIDLLFTKSIDGKTLATGQDLIKTVQKLVDDNLKSKVAIKATSQFDYSTIDLSCLTGETCNTVMSQEQIISLLIKEVCFLKGKLINISTNY